MTLSALNVSPDVLLDYAELLYNSYIPHPDWKPMLQKAAFLSDQIIQANPGFWRGWCLLGDIFLMQKDYDQALTCFRNAVMVAPSEPKTNFMLHHALRVLGHHDEAETQIEKLHNVIDPNSPIPRYLKSHDIKKIALGTGETVYPGWLSMDYGFVNDEIVFLDARYALAFPTASVDYIHSENMLEHITYQHNAFLMKEIFRVLEPGGKARLVTHGLKPMASLVAGSALNDMQKHYVHWINETFTDFFDIKNLEQPCFATNMAFFNHGHKFLFDFETLSELARLNGFTNITSPPLNKSVDPNLCNMEKHGEVIPPECYEYEGLIIEIEKPAQV